MLGILLAAIKKFLLGLISLATLIAIITNLVTGHPPGGNAPTAASASITTNEDTPSAPVTPSVTDADAGETFTFSIVAQPANGAATVVGNQLIYTPNPDYNGSDSFTFRATDSTNLSVDGAASVAVIAVNDAPGSTSAAIVTNEDTASPGVTPNVNDPDAGDSFTFAIVNQPSRGSATSVGNQLVYTPDLNYNGSDSFSFSATDAGGLAVTGTASVTVLPVNDAPTATGASRSIFRGLAGGGSRVPWMDDVDIFDTATFQITSQPANGVASVVGNALTYVPNAGTNATTDGFTYQATDSGGATVNGAMRLRLFGNANRTTCTQVSTVNPDGTLADRTRAHPCAFFQRSDTREGSTAAPVTIDYIRNWPSNTDTPRGIVVLIAGGDLGGNDPETFIAGNDAAGQATASPGNFVVRTAQLFADAGFLALAVERPSDEPAGNATVDQYRISVRHAVDIVGILKHSNPTNLPVFLVGTSRGAMSAVANNAIATGIALPSPVTSNNGFDAFLYVGRPDTPSLLPSAVKRPAHVLWHDNDQCSVSTPAGSQTLANDLTTAGVSTVSNIASGGVEVTAPPSEVDNCGALDFHGFLGIEPTAVGFIITWLNARVDDLGADKLPEAAYVTVPTAPGVAKQIDLAPLTRDADGDALSYALSHTATVLGGTVALNGSTVTYIPPASVNNKTDYFVYVVTDGKGGVSAAVIAIQIGS